MQDAKVMLVSLQCPLYRQHATSEQQRRRCPVPNLTHNMLCHRASYRAGLLISLRLSEVLMETDPSPSAFSSSHYRAQI